MFVEGPADWFPGVPERVDRQRAPPTYRVSVRPDRREDADRRRKPPRDAGRGRQGDRADRSHRLGARLSVPSTRCRSRQRTLGVHDDQGWRPASGRLVPRQGRRGHGHARCRRRSSSTARPWSSSACRARSPRPATTRISRSSSPMPAAFKAKGVDRIVVMAVNDHHVMKVVGRSARRRRQDRLRRRRRRQLHPRARP